MVGDYVIGQVPTVGTGLRVAQAVGASAAVPGLLAPMVLKGPSFPCQRGRVVRLVDGGVYDNMGLEPVDDLADALLVALNAAGLLVTGRYRRVALLRDLQLAQSLLYRQSTALRRRWMVERLQGLGGGPRRRSAAAQVGPPRGAVRAGPRFEPAPDGVKANPQAPDPGTVALVATSFDRFPRQRCQELVHAGWWLTGASLATYHRDVLGTDLPVRRPPP